MGCFRGSSARYEAQAPSRRGLAYCEHSEAELDIVAPPRPSAAPSTTYYISPFGADENDGKSNAAPFLTWDRAFRVLAPGDTLVVMEGVYGADSGVAEARCGGESENYSAWTTSSRCLKGPKFHKCGTLGAPITVRTEAGEERLAHLTVAGPSSPIVGTWAGLRVLNCSHWNFQGLRVQGGDNDSKLGVGGVVDVWNSAHINLRRMLVHDTNRYANQQALRILRSSDILVEESEAYNYAIHGFTATDSSRVTFRRNYANCNRYENIEGNYWGFPVGKNCSPATGTNTNGTTVVQGAGFAFSPASDSVMENNVAESTSWGFLNVGETAVDGLTDASRNRFFGNIALDNTRSLGITAHTVGATSDIVVRDFVSVAPVSEALWAYNTWTRNLLIENVSLFGKSGLPYASGLKVEPPSGADDSTFIWKALVMGHGSASTPAIKVSNIDFCSVRAAAIHGNANDGYPGSSGAPSAECAVEDVSTSDPNDGADAGSQVGLGVGRCIVYIPDGNASLKDAAAWSARSRDIGANVVNRYENGEVLPAKLWEQATGAFACGADAIGDSAPNRCANVHTRLNVGHNGCPIP